MAALSDAGKQVALELTPFLELFPTRESDEQNMLVRRASRSGDGVEAHTIVTQVLISNKMGSPATHDTTQRMILPSRWLQKRARTGLLRQPTSVNIQAVYKTGKKKY